MKISPQPSEQTQNCVIREGLGCLHDSLSKLPLCLFLYLVERLKGATRQKMESVVQQLTESLQKAVVRFAQDDFSIPYFLAFHGSF